MQVPFLGQNMMEILEYFIKNSSFPRHAENLAPMDKNGLADPFVEINLHKDLVLKTRFINRNLNPVWNEKFVEYIDDRSALANINVS